MKSRITLCSAIALMSLSMPCLGEEMNALREGRSIGRPDTGSEQVYWLGFAVSPQGRVFRNENNGGSESTARQGAKNECELKAGSTCRAIAVPASWDVSAISCQGGTFVGGSGQGFAEKRAKLKAADEGVDEYSCREIYKY